MADMMDYVHDLAHKAVDMVSGAQKPAVPAKPAYAAEDASRHLGGGSGMAAQKISGRQAQIDKAVDDAS